VAASGASATKPVPQDEAGFRAALRWLLLLVWVVAACAQVFALIGPVRDLGLCRPPSSDQSSAWFWSARVVLVLAVLAWIVLQQRQADRADFEVESIAAVLVFGVLLAVGAVFAAFVVALVRVPPTPGIAVASTVPLVYSFAACSATTVSLRILGLRQVSLLRVQATAVGVMAAVLGLFAAYVGGFVAVVCDFPTVFL
jgi:hypothetical protein